MAFSDFWNARQGDEADDARDESRERLIDALWDWSYIGGAFVSLAATGWLVVTVWPTA